MKGNLPDTNATLVRADDQQAISPVPPNQPNPLRSPGQRRPVENYTVQQAAALTGLSEHTLRYYEKIGLIQPVQRQESSGHRRYSSDDLTKLEALACLRATGMPIDQIRRYFELRSHGADAAAERRSDLNTSRNCIGAWQNCRCI